MCQTFALGFNMPTYEYACKECNHQFEVRQNITKDPLQQCPKCNQIALRRLISKGGGVIFKGSGFYATDYRDPPKIDS